MTSFTRTSYSNGCILSETLRTWMAGTSPRLSGSIFCGQGAWRGFFCVLSASHTFETPKEVHAMRHQNSVFHSLTKHIPWTKFAQIVEKYGADQLVSKLTTKR